MNQQTTNSSFINNSSGPSSLSSPVAPAEASSLKATRKSKVTAKASIPKAAAPTAATKRNDRCRHYTSTGRRCRLSVLDPASGLCFRHVGHRFEPSDEDLSPAFVGLLSGFQSASRIHDFLTQVTVLLVQNRISTRRAAILAYLGQILLRTLPAIDCELDEKEDHQPVIFDIPCAVASRAMEAQRLQAATTESPK